MRRRFRPLFLTSTALISGLAWVAAPLLAQTLNSYGMPGAVDTPSAVAPPEGEFSATISNSDYGRRVTLSFQPVPKLTASLRYASIDGIDPRRDKLRDRSFDVQYQVFDEQGWRPSVAVGLRDFLGTGIYSSEYLVATKKLRPNVTVSAGVGWGRMAGDWRRTDYQDEGGKPNVDQWFTGSAKPFASVAWQATDKLSVLAEYSYDDYEPEVEGGADAPDGNINLGVNYALGDTYQIGAYTIGGKTFGIRAAVALNAKKSPYPSGLEKAPAPVRPRASPASDPEGWSGAWSADPTAQPAIQAALGDALRKEGQMLESMSLSATRAEVRIANRRYPQQAEAIGRTARLMTRALPPSVETFVITALEGGTPTSSVVLKRSDIERLENTAAGRIAQTARIENAAPRPGDLVPTPGIYPKFDWRVRPYASIGLFDPDEPFRYEVGARASASYEIVPGLVLSGSVRQRAFGSIDQKGPANLTPEQYLALDTDENEFGVPRVRTDSRMYTSHEGPVVPDLTLAWYAKPTETIYTRVTFGLLERAYGGISAEALWKPVDSRLGLGAEVNHVRKRDFEKPFGFRDYETTTGHLSAYYDFGGGIWGELGVGRYLAGDVGARIALNREFKNGWSIGGYVTKTDLSNEEFGEGSFDKGINFQIPIGWATGMPTKQSVSGSLNSLNRDGGARVRVSGRLYQRIRDSQTDRIYDGWGKFWR